MKIEEKNGNLVITDFNEFELYRIACRVEKDGMDFYRRLLNATSAPDIRKALEFLLAEEKKHLGFFEDCLAGLRQQSEDPSEDNDLIEAMDYGVFSPVEQLGKLESVVKDPAKAMKLGLTIEDRSVRFYSACLDLVKSPETHSELKKIIEEEERHKELFSGLLGRI